MSIKNLKPKKTITSWYCKVRSRHPSHDVLRRSRTLLMPYRSLVRFGSPTKVEEVYPKSYMKGVVELNTVEAIQNSSSKFKMKSLFVDNGVESPEFYHFKGDGMVYYSNTRDGVYYRDLPYPLIAKKNYGSRGAGMVRIGDEEELRNFVNSQRSNISSYYSSLERALHCAKMKSF